MVTRAGSCRKSILRHRYSMPDAARALYSTNRTVESQTPEPHARAFRVSQSRPSCLARLSDCAPTSRSWHCPLRSYCAMLGTSLKAIRHLTSLPLQLPSAVRGRPEPRWPPTAALGNLPALWLRVYSDIPLSPLPSGARRLAKKRLRIAKCNIIENMMPGKNLPG
jgi:hypothetical protein